MRLEQSRLLLQACRSPWMAKAGREAATPGISVLRSNLAALCLLTNIQKRPGHLEVMSGFFPPSKLLYWPTGPDGGFSGSDYAPARPSRLRSTARLPSPVLSKTAMEHQHPFLGPIGKEGRGDRRVMAVGDRGPQAAGVMVSGIRGRRSASQPGTYTDQQRARPSHRIASRSPRSTPCPRRRQWQPSSFPNPLPASRARC